MRDKKYENAQEVIAATALWRDVPLVTQSINLISMYEGKQVSPADVKNDSVYILLIHDNRDDIPKVVSGRQINLYQNQGFVCELPDMIISELDCSNELENLKKEFDINGKVDYLKPTPITKVSQDFCQLHTQEYQSQKLSQEIQSEDKATKRDKRLQRFYVNRDARMALAEKYIDISVTVACRSSQYIKSSFWTVDDRNQPYPVNVNDLESGDIVLVGSPNDIFGTPDLVQDTVHDVMIDEKHSIYIVEMEGGLVLSSIDIEKELAELITIRECTRDEPEIEDGDRIL